MEWHHPHVLWALLLVAVFAFVMGRLLVRRRAALVRFAEAGLVDRLLEGVDRRGRRARLVLRCMAFTMLIIALAGPRWGFRWEEVRREGIDLLVALDTSRSMLATDVAPDRLERAKLAIMDLVRRLDGDRVGLVAFAGTAFLECPLTLDYAAFERTVRALHAGIIPRGGTALAQAIDTSLKSFDARQGKYQALVLVTDGEDHEGNVEEAADRAAKAGVKIFTVGIGTAEGELLPAEGASGFFKDRKGNVVKSRLNEETLTTIAHKSGGAYVRGLGASLGLDEVFERHIATMERRDVGSRLERRGEDRFQLPLALAVFLLLVEAALPDRRRTSIFARARALLTRRVTAALVAFLLLAGHAAAARAATDPGVEGYRLYAEGQYADAADRWREALIDQPDSPLLRFNLGTALFRDSKFDEAAEAFGRVAASADPQWKAKAGYNWGNALYRVGQKAESSEPEAAVKSWEQSLEAYRVAMASDRADEDAKLAYEFVSGRLKALRDKLEKEREQQKQEESEQQPPSQEPPQGRDQQQDQASQGQERQQQQPGSQAEQKESDAQQQAGAGGEDKPEPQADAGAEQDEERASADPSEAQDKTSTESESAQRSEEHDASSRERNNSPSSRESDENPQPEESPQPEAQQGLASGDAAEHGGGSASAARAGDEQPPADARAARAVLDAVRREELGPDDVDRTMGAAIVADPSEDW